MDWRLKGVAQGILSRVPGGVRVNDLLQRTLGERGNPTAHVDSKFREDWLVHVANLASLGFPLTNRHVLEVGTGWLPVMPLAFALAGVDRCTTVDLSRHLRPRGVTLALAHLERHLEEIARVSGRDRREVADRWQAWRREPDGEAVLRAARVDYRAPADATATGLPSASVDLVFSNSVLEHMPAAAIDALMRESARVLTADGLALHSVNCGDHYAYFDRSITPIHYLRFGERAWARWNNDLLYQNRLRPEDFLASARRAGLEILLDTHRPRPDLLARLPELPIAPEFRHYPPDQLCATSVDFAARRSR
ncbi:MAG: class I SAM-dependent methyltransferase [Deltaproteobacteria bacterium]|nr:class I SAM-dependent methyltransferase [Deltaproteobacteria bacterium]